MKILSKQNKIVFGLFYIGTYFIEITCIISILLLNKLRLN